jgi:hypothetical protein
MRTYYLCTPELEFNTNVVCHSGMNVLAFIMIFFWVPETKERTLEELDYIFAVPVSRFAGYQLKTALPWWFKRYVFFNKNATRKPLYKFAEGLADHKTMRAKSVGKV